MSVKATRTVSTAPDSTSARSSSTLTGPVEASTATSLSTAPVPGRRHPSLQRADLDPFPWPGLLSWSASLFRGRERDAHGRTTLHRHLPRSRARLLRQAQPPTTRRRVVAVGARRRGRHLRRLLRLELRSRVRVRRASRRHAGHHGDVPPALLLDRRDVARPRAHRWRILLRPNRHGP